MEGIPFSEYNSSFLPEMISDHITTGGIDDSTADAYLNLIEDDHSHLWSNPALELFEELQRNLTKVIDDEKNIGLKDLLENEPYNFIDHVTTEKTDDRYFILGIWK